MKSVTAIISIIGINPYVSLPGNVLQYLFKKFGKEKGQIPVRLVIGKESFAQTLVKYKGEWRLYLNTPMRRAAGKEVSDKITLKIDYDANDRTTPLHPRLEEALQRNNVAGNKFSSLPPSRRKEIARYINNLKSEEAVIKNVARAINFLLGEERFIGRDNP